MECPHCGKEDFLPDYVHENVVSYGNCICRFACSKCNQLIKARIKRTAEVVTAIKTNEASDW